MQAMIKFSLRCDSDHSFESWFRSSGAYDALDKAGMLSCPVCGSERISKAMMSPSVAAAANKAEPEEKADLSKPASTAEQALAKLRTAIEKHSEYVGMDFSTEARAIHDGDAPKRSIYGEAKPEEARALIEDGISVAPIPWMSSDRTN